MSTIAPIPVAATAVQWASRVESVMRIGSGGEGGLFMAHAADAVFLTRLSAGRPWVITIYKVTDE
ncbi:MAG TPA: hypothetical protein VLC46_00150 [Thermoanaerobaculia bacterium]|nr:hypothetical protein [Thermoanaerobaculia bacterium]